VLHWSDHPEVSGRIVISFPNMAYEGKQDCFSFTLPNEAIGWFQYAATVIPFDMIPAPNLVRCVHSDVFAHQLTHGV
jgi:hypothetical protein